MVTKTSILFHILMLSFFISSHSHGHESSHSLTHGLSHSHGSSHSLTHGLSHSHGSSHSLTHGLSQSLTHGLSHSHGSSHSHSDGSSHSHESMSRDRDDTTLILKNSICNDTPFPQFCQFNLDINKSSSVQEIYRLSLSQSLLSTYSFKKLIDHRLSLRFAYKERTIRALEDCQILSSLNKEFLDDTLESIGSNTSVSNPTHEYIQTLLSATLTNLDTCLDSLNETSSISSLQDALLNPLNKGTKYYSVSLALFLKGWDRGNNTRQEVASSEAKSSSTFSINIIHGRKILQDIEIGGVRTSKTVVVNQDGSGDFKTISDAVHAAPNNPHLSDGYFLIKVAAGVYKENVTISSNKKYIMMIGDGINKTILTGDRSVVDGWTTYNSATLAVQGRGFVAVNMTFQNTAGSMKHQAVAVRDSADLSVFYKCSFEAYQDTLYTHSMRQFYRECDVYGTVDFIFGNAEAVFQNCNLYPRLPMSGQFNAITAQGRKDPNQSTGISIHNCTIKAAPDLAASKKITKTYLGRPWKEFSTTVYMQTNMDSLIDPAGWIEWSGDYALSTLYYGEYKNTGPGSVTANRVTWPGYHVITDPSEAVPFTVSSFIDGDEWLPITAVPYIPGLIDDTVAPSFAPAPSPSKLPSLAPAPSPSDLSTTSLPSEQSSLAAANALTEPELPSSWREEISRVQIHI